MVTNFPQILITELHLNYVFPHNYYISVLLFLVSALIYNLKFHYVCSFNSLKFFGGGAMGNRNKSKMNNFECTFFFFTIVKYKFSLILISCTSPNPYITNNQINFMLLLQDWML